MLDGVLLVPLRREPSFTGWAQGPLPLPWGREGSTDATTRSTYFEERAAELLYGRRRSRRLHRWFEEPAPVGRGELIALEWLSVRNPLVESPGIDVLGVLVLHLRCAGHDLTEQLTRWNEIARWKTRSDGRVPVVDELERVLGTRPVLAQGVDRAFAISLARGTAASEAAPYPRVAAPALARWLFAAASADAGGGYTPGPRQLAIHDAQRLELSADWSALVLRDGVGFVGTDRDTAGPRLLTGSLHGEDGHAGASADDPASGFLDDVAPVLVRSIYTDVFLLGLVQSATLLTLTDRLAAVEEPSRAIVQIKALDESFSRFRNALWWQHLTRHGHANELLERFHAQRQLPSLVTQLTGELEDYTRQASLRAGQFLNATLALFALVGLVGVVVDVYLLYNTPRVAPSLLVSLAAGVTLLAGVVLLLRLTIWRRE